VRVEDIYGEDSPEPTKRTDTPRKSKMKPVQKEEEKVINGVWKFVFLTLLTSFFVGFIKGMGSLESPTNKVY